MTMVAVIARGGIQNEWERWVVHRRYYFLEGLDNCSIRRLLRAMITVCGEVKNNLAERIGLIADLNKKTWATGVLICDIVENKVEICHRGRPGVQDTVRSTSYHVVAELRDTR
jgi:hypothetical protein